jgi:hypothetical protein
MTGTGIPAAELLAAGECTPACLLAREPDGCACRCGGTWHGAVSGVPVSPRHFRSPGSKSRTEDGELTRPPEASLAHPGPAREARVSYGDVVRDFSHAGLARLPAYGRLRQALSDVANEAAEAGGMRLADWLAVVRDMAVTAPFGDMCNGCCRVCARTHQHDDADAFPRPCGAYRLWWPHTAERRGEYTRGLYRCDQGHTWTWSWSVNIAALR